ncbi:hypothetical protein G6011_08402 [Alternaria panax]|uniref:Uncharacterized protein n=1 Tax=Alternaria panax TaxID=48097 RepID=A0AAD4FGV8_9PLEO|nr:hypothetical protein G6011_08402 [Alternaria panax]
MSSHISTVVMTRPGGTDLFAVPARTGHTPPPPNSWCNLEEEEEVEEEVEKAAVGDVVPVKRPNDDDKENRPPPPKTNKPSKIIKLKYGRKKPTPPLRGSER